MKVQRTWGKERAFWNVTAEIGNQSFSFKNYRSRCKTPKEVRAVFKNMGYTNVNISKVMVTA